MKFTLFASTILFAAALAAPVQDGPSGSGSSYFETRNSCRTTCPSICQTFGYSSGTCVGCYMNCRLVEPDAAAPEVTERDVKQLEARSKCKTTCPGVCDMYGWDSGVCSGCYMNCRRDVAEAEPAVQKRSVDVELEARSNCKTTCPGVCDMYGWDSGVCSGCYMNCRRDAPEELGTRESEDEVKKRDVESFETRSKCTDTCSELCEMFGWENVTCSNCFVWCQ